MRSICQIWCLFNCLQTTWVSSYTVSLSFACDWHQSESPTYVLTEPLTFHDGERASASFDMPKSIQQCKNFWDDTFTWRFPNYNIGSCTAILYCNPLRGRFADEYHIKVYVEDPAHKHFLTEIDAIEWHKYPVRSGEQLVVELTYEEKLLHEYNRDNDFQCVLYYRCYAPTEETLGDFGRGIWHHLPVEQHQSENIQRSATTFRGRGCESTGGSCFSGPWQWSEVVGVGSWFVNCIPMDPSGSALTGDFANAVYHCPVRTADGARVPFDQASRFMRPCLPGKSECFTNFTIMPSLTLRTEGCVGVRGEVCLPFVTRSNSGGQWFTPCSSASIKVANPNSCATAVDIRGVPSAVAECDLVASTPECVQRRRMLFRPVNSTHPYVLVGIQPTT